MPLSNLVFAIDLITLDHDIESHMELPLFIFEIMAVKPGKRTIEDKEARRKPKYSTIKIIIGPVLIFQRNFSAFVNIW